MSSGSLDDRTVSSFGISIGTGISLESIFIPTTARYDTTREVPVIIKASDYKVHYYNIYTIARNILSSTPSKDKVELINSSEFLDTLQEELYAINSLYIDIQPDVVFYHVDYGKLYKKYNAGKEVGITKNYIEYSALLNRLKGYGSKLSVKIVTTIPSGRDKSIIFTHYMLDLINLKSNFYLLEAHTGKLKDISKWNSKYGSIGKRDASMLPIVDVIYYLMGDKTLIKSRKVSEKIALYNLAVGKKWTVRTSRDKVISDINNDEVLMHSISTFK